MEVRWGDGAVSGERGQDGGAGRGRERGLLSEGRRDHAGSGGQGIFSWTLNEDVCILNV